MKKQVLISWVGMTDLRCSRGEQTGLGPVGQALTQRKFHKAFLLVDSGVTGLDDYVRWLTSLTKTRIQTLNVKLAGPTDYRDIYQAAIQAIKFANNDLRGEDCVRTYHLSPGTPAMCAVWLLLSKTSYPAQLIESSERHGVKTVDVPFDISIDFMPERSPRVDEELRALTNGLPPITAELDAIVHQSPEMKSLIARARRVAAFDYPILIQGETGTGKELLARAIHSVSRQKDGPFIPVNCGAIPEALVEAQFFGHKKGAFTGATGDQSGFIEAANGGTLFLDEIGELPRQAQVKLLRFLQEGTVQRIGETKERRAVVRVIAATNRNLVEEVVAGNFRADLFHRLAFGVLTIPPLRERGSDAELLIHSILSEINAKCSLIPGWTTKKLTPSARNLVRRYNWPGNVRELNSTLIRAAMWTSTGTIRFDDLRDALISDLNPESDRVRVLGRELGNGLNLPSILGDVANHYLSRALEATGGNKTEAAKLIGLASHQTLSNWLAKYAKE